MAGEAVRPGDAGTRGAGGLCHQAQGEAGAGDARAHGVYGAGARRRCAGAATRAAGQYPATACVASVQLTLLDCSGAPFLFDTNLR